jgi:hypothetical protein
MELTWLASVQLAYSIKIKMISRLFKFYFGIDETTTRPESLKVLRESIFDG